jgi:PDZ domain-containing secreted protein
VNTKEWDCIFSALYLGGIKISQLPKLMVKIFGSASEDICELEQAQYLFSLGDKTIMVEGQRVLSYDELVQLVNQDKYKNKELIEVVLLPTIAGG